MKKARSPFGKPSNGKRFGKSSEQESFGKPSNGKRFGKSSEQESFGKPAKGRFNSSEANSDDRSEKRRAEGRFPKASTGRPNGRFGKSQPGGQFNKPTAGRPSKGRSSR